MRATRSYLICNAITHTVRTNNLLTAPSIHAALHIHNSSLLRRRLLACSLAGRQCSLSLSVCFHTVSVMYDCTAYVYFIIKASGISLVIQTVICSNACNATQPHTHTWSTHYPNIVLLLTHILPMPTYHFYAMFFRSFPLAQQSHLTLDLVRGTFCPVAVAHTTHTHTQSALSCQKEATTTRTTAKKMK